MQNNLPQNLQQPGIQLNNKDNLNFLTYLRFSTEEMEKTRPIIERIIQKGIPDIGEYTKSEVWAKLIVYSMELEFYPDNKVGMNDICAEIEKQNKCKLVTPPRYLTKPSNRERKIHSTIVGVFRNKQEADKWYTGEHISSASPVAQTKKITGKQHTTAQTV